METKKLRLHPLNEQSADQPSTQDNTTRSRNGYSQHPPAKEFLNGRVLTRIWANPNHWQEITWRVDQLRIRLGDRMAPTAKSFHIEDLQDAMRGLYQAQKWIRRATRRRRFTLWRLW